jgi:Icc-related predicted phosphoesterase
MISSSTSRSFDVLPTFFPIFFRFEVFDEPTRTARRECVGDDCAEREGGLILAKRYAPGEDERLLAFISTEGRLEESAVKLLLFSDLHASTSAARRLVDRARSVDVDVVVGAGDFGNQRRQVGVCIDVLRAIAKPAVLVAGNNESVEELTEAAACWPQAQVLHGSQITIGGVPFFGIGGGIPVTPFGAWSYDFTEEQAAALLAGCPERCVLISHSPPRGLAVDRTSRGQNVGSTAVRDAVIRAMPRLVVCGHIHDSAGQQELIGSSPVINVGPGGIEWVLDAEGA